MGQQDIAANIQKGNINVVVRVRPLNNSERFANESNVLQFPGNGGIVATSQDKGNVIKSFTFILDFKYNFLLQNSANMSLKIPNKNFLDYIERE